MAIQAVTTTGFVSPAGVPASPAAVPVPVPQPRAPSGGSTFQPSPANRGVDPVELSFGNAPMSAIARSESEKARAHITSSPRYQALPARQRVELARVFRDVNFEGRMNLAYLFTGNGRGLSKRDVEGNTLIDNLYQLATEPLGIAFQIPGAYSREQVLADTLSSSSMSLEADQGGFNTCTTTSMQRLLKEQNPAEYARLIAELVGPSGEAKTAGHDAIPLDMAFVKPTLDAEQSKARSADSAIFQSAVMQAAKAARPKAGQLSIDGLDKPQEQWLLSSLMGRPYQLQTIISTDQARAAVAGLSTHLMGPDAPVLLDINVRADGAELTDEQFLADVGHASGHAVALDYIKGGRAYFNDPNGAIPKDAEGNFTVRAGEMDPVFGGVRVENPEDGERSMDLAELERRLTGVYQAA